ncbi:MAG: outer membrane beta-barrel protein [Flavobacteriales bacterium]|nr:outer membrane beta-barrel protein [Flavobacteriales bacterium]
MKRFLFLLCITFIALASPSHGQSKTDVTGHVVDTAALPLPSSTVVIMAPEDSTLLKFTITDDQGMFTLKGVDAGKYILQISFMGFKSISKNIEVDASQSTYDLGALILKEDRVTLGATTIEGTRIPILFKGDTVEYNAQSFKPKANDAVEKLLEKMPGVEVDEDGTVKAQGEEVKKVLVDGKEFFGDDPKLATKNLPADAIEKVQVYDKKSDVAEFTGVDDGDRQKVINLILKEGRKKGYFGSVMGGGGTNERYEGTFNVNRFSKKTQMSVIGMANNTNQQGFSTRDYINFMGGLGNLMRGGGGRAFRRSADIPIGQGVGTGFTNTGAVGINLFNKFGIKTDVNVSYFFNGIRNISDQATDRESFANGENYFTEDSTSSNQQSANHRISFRLKHDIDSSADVVVKGGVKYNDGTSTSDGQTLNTTPLGLPISNSDVNNRNHGTGLNADINLTHRKKLKKDGRTIVTDLTYSVTDNDSRGNMLSTNGFFIDSLQFWTYQDIWQLQKSITNRHTYGGKILYTEPLGNKRYLQFTAEHNRKTDESVKHFYDLDDNPTYQEILNPQLSNEFSSDYFYNRIGSNFMLNRNQYNVTFGLEGQYAFLQGEVQNTGARVSKEFRTLLPSIDMQYRYNNSKRLTLRYESSLNEPSVDQLQPVTDNSNPLNIYVGNPNLRAEYAHSVSLRYMAYSQFNFTSFFAYLQATYTGNKITNSVTVDELLRQTTRPVNVDNDLNVTGYVTYSHPLKFMKAKANLRSNLMYGKSIQYINGDQDNLQRFVNAYTVSLENLKKGKLNTEAGVRLSQNLSFYEANTNFNQNFLTSRYFVDFDVDIKKTWTFNTDFSFTVYSGEAFVSNQVLPIWKAYVAKRFLKEDRGELKFAVIDILNRNNGISRNSDVNYVEEQRIHTLGRYGMVSFTYKFRALGKKSS